MTNNLFRMMDRYLGLIAFINISTSKALLSV